MLKKLLNMTLAVLIVFGSLGPAPFLRAVARAATPDTISYQGRLRDADGIAVANGPYDFTFALFDGPNPEEDNADWTENQTVTVTDGYFSVQLGSADPFNDDLGEETNLNDARWLQVTVDEEVLDPLVAVNSVAYAMTSRAVESLSVAPDVADSYGGRTYYNTVDGQLYVFDATVDPDGAWISATDQSPTFSGLVTADGGITADGGVFTVENGTGNVFTGGSVEADGGVDFTGVVSLGDGLDSVLINSSDWDITSDGNMTGIGDIGMNGNFSQTGATTLSTGTGDVSLNGNTAVSGTLNVDGLATVGGTLDVTGDSTLGGTLNLAGDFAVATDKFNVTAGSGNTAIAGLLSADGGISMGSAEITGTVGGIVYDSWSVSSDGDIHAEGTLSTDSGLIVNGTSALNGNVTIDGTLDVSGDSTLASIGAVTAGSGAFTTLTASGDLTTDGVFTANGEIFLGNDPSDPINISGTMVPGGSGTLEMTTAGESPATFVMDNADNSIVISSDTWDVGANGNISTIGELSVDGQSVLDGTVSVGEGYGSTGVTLSSGGNIQANGSLSVDSTSTLSGAVTANGGIDADGGAFTVEDDTGDVHTSGSLDVDGDATFASIGAVTAGSGAFTTLTTSGDLTTNGVFSANGEMYLGDDASDTLSVTGAVKPGGNNTLTMETSGSFGGIASVVLNNADDSIVISSDTWDVAANGNISTSGSLDVDGDATFASIGADVAGTGAFTELDIGGGYGANGVSISETGNIEADGTLTVDGASTLSGDVSSNGTGSFLNLTSGGGYGSNGFLADSDGNVSANGNLSIDGTSTFSGLVLVDVTSTFTGLATINGDITTSGDLPLSVVTGGSGTLTLDTGTMGTVNVGTGASAKSINVGTGAGGNVINVGTDNTAADTINVGSGLDAVSIAGSTITLNGAITADGGVFSVANGNGNLHTSGAMDVDGITTLDGNVALGDAEDDLVTVAAENMIFSKEQTHIIQIAASTSNDTAGSVLTVRSGDGNDALGGNMVVSAGSGGGAFGGGEVILSGGGSGDGAIGNGGSATVNGGDALSEAGSGGDVNVRGGTATTSGTGGSVSLIGGASGDLNGTAGSIIIDAGDENGGSSGTVSVGVSNASTILIAGGYGSSGVTISSVGNISVNGTLTVDGEATFTSVVAANGGINVGAQDIIGTTGLITYDEDTTWSSFDGTITISAADDDNSGENLLLTVGNLLPPTLADANDIELRAEGDVIAVASGEFRVQTNGNQAFQVVNAGRTISLYDDPNAKTIHIGAVNSDAADTINIATNAARADNITIGNSHADTLTSIIGGNDWSISATGVITAVFDNSGGNDFAVCTLLDDSGNAQALEDCDASANADYAERYPTDGTSTYGDIVVPGSNVVYQEDEYNGRRAIAQAVKSSVPYQGPVIGIVSNNYGDFTSAGNNIDAADLPMPVALVGRVPVNVTNENGPIAVGDFVTTSSTAGKGMKATEAGRVIGMALSSFGGTDGQVMVQVINTWYQPDASGASSIQGGSSAALSVASGDLVVSGDATFDGSVTVAEHLVGSSDMAGRASIVAGDTRVHVTFENEYAYQPIVNATLRSNVNIEGYWFIEEESTTGFDIVLDGTLASDVEFNWIAVGVDGGEVSVSDGSTRDIELYVLDGSAPVADEPVADSSSSSSSSDEVVVADEVAVDESVAADEPIVEETLVVEETPVVIEEPVVEETPAEEAPVVEETPAADEPVAEPTVE